MHHMINGHFKVMSIQKTRMAATINRPMFLFFLITLFFSAQLLQGHSLLFFYNNLASFNFLTIRKLLYISHNTLTFLGLPQFQYQAFKSKQQCFLFTYTSLFLSVISIDIVSFFFYNLPCMSSSQLFFIVLFLWVHNGFFFMYLNVDTVNSCRNRSRRRMGV